VPLKLSSKFLLTQMSDYKFLFISTRKHTTVKYCHTTDEDSWSNFRLNTSYHTLSTLNTR